jgi:antitoxin MazE
VKLSKWGNSLAVRIPATIAEEAGLQEGATVDMETVGDGVLRLTPLRRALTIDVLAAKITEENRHEEADWGRPVGNEAW